jgi:hypothetical protein
MDGLKKSNTILKKQLNESKESHFADRLSQS